MFCRIGYRENVRIALRGEACAVQRRGSRVALDLYYGPLVVAVYSSGEERGGEATEDGRGGHNFAGYAEEVDKDATLGESSRGECPRRKIQGLTHQSIHNWVKEVNQIALAVCKKRR